MDREVILIINTDDVERRRLSQACEQAGYGVFEAKGSVKGLFRVLESDPGLVLLAEKMPPLQATDLLPVLRRLTEVPIVVIGSGGDTGEAAVLEDGADYYHRRPVSRGVLETYIRALVRRYRSSGVNRKPRFVSNDLTPTERRVLSCLTAQFGRTVAAERLLRDVWNGTTSWGSVKFNVWRLRQKSQGSSLEVQPSHSRGNRVIRRESGAESRRIAE